MMIIAEHLAKAYDGNVALRGLNFTVQEGDVFGFLGPNGAGKTTTIRILTTIIKADSGRALVAGHDVAKDPMAVRRMINGLLESNGYYEWMTASDYLRFFATLYEKAPSRAELSGLLGEVGLHDRGKQPIRSFSRGMKQRLGIARSLINTPRLLFLDEPTAGLDPKGRRDIHDLLLRLNRKHGTTIFLSTHLLDDVERLCNRLAVIKRGRIVSVGDLEQVKGRHTIEEVFLSLTKESP